MGPGADAAENDVGASAARIDGKTDRQSARNQNECRIALKRVAVIGMTKVIATDARLSELLKNIDAADRVALDTEADSLHSYREKLCLIQISVPSAVILSNIEGSRGTASEVALRDGKPGLLPCGGYVAASSSLGTTVESVRDFIVDPLRDLDFEPLRELLQPK